MSDDCIAKCCDYHSSHSRVDTRENKCTNLHEMKEKLCQDLRGYDYGNMMGWTKGMPRFWVEKRVGCIAVIDSDKFIHKNLISPPIGENVLGVLWFRESESHICECKICEKKGYKTWYVSKECVDEAVRLADRLNAEADIPFF